MMQMCSFLRRQQPILIVVLTYPDTLLKLLQKQMQDQRVAGAAHILLAPGKCTLPLQEAIALMKQWKEEIGDDAEKFAERVSRSRCEAAA